jgi:hypothetical protein
MAPDNCYLEVPLPHLYVSSAWLTTLSPAINDPPLTNLAQGYYDERSRKIMLIGTAANTAGYGGAMAIYGQPITADYGGAQAQVQAAGGGGTTWADNVGTGLDLVNNGTQLANTVVPMVASAGSACCVIL